MRALLDTHTLLWALLDPTELSPRVREVVKNRENELFVSAATAWEISTKFRLGKLPQAEEVANHYLEVTATFGVEHLSISPLHSLTAGKFQAVHRDPFDRMLAAQAIHENLSVLTKDSAMKQFPISVIWE